MHRDEVIATLVGLAAPLGPFTTHDERLEQQDRWVDEGGAALLEALVDLIAAPPPAERLGDASPEDWSILLVEVAGTLGNRHPDLALERLLPLLDDQRARATAIDVLGGVGDMRAVPELQRLVRSRRLDTDELMHIAGALGEIGGEAACDALRLLRESAAEGELRQEIDVALELAGCSN